MSVLRTIAIITAVAGVLSFNMSAGFTAQTASGADTAKPLSSAEIYRIYGNNSWMWKDGAGYFAVSKRQFKAWSGRGSNASVGSGIWFITDPGKLCFRATWHERGGTVPATTCFSHRGSNGVIYQRREPGGDWYVFKNAPVRKGNEITKFRRGDYVSRRVDQMMPNMASN
ncbi:DUF995 domain-containing protein [Pseudochrobactrum sp. sp1633]|uniref:DUF995 domain-containing protein n=1 Tax=Pseudochrobactrum sp. sp1633 TaxID=3036706 RepID=UPI0025A5E740|nr:DUF995 domain-containing protein [Pseudochrobactrum sp. sp1633]